MVDVRNQRFGVHLAFDEAEKITNICEYIDSIALMSSAISHFNKLNRTNLKLFFRGQTNHLYGVSPSIFRENRIENESVAVRELTLLVPREFDVNIPLLERLSKMQHYGLPTRLLDITANPLVALFFSCWENERNKNIDKDGEVIVIIDKPVTPEDRRANFFSSLAEYDKVTSLLYDFIAFLVDKGVMKEEESRDAKKIDCFTRRFLTVVPSMNNDRIRRQQGAFLLFGTEWNGSTTKFCKKSFDIKAELLDNKKDGIARKIKIPASNKKELLEELNVLGINEATLFPELEHQASYISDRINAIIRR